MRDKIIEHYKTLLAVGWLAADEEGQVSVVLGDETMPAVVNGKRLILPTREQMKNTNWENRIGFHPLRESYNLGVSDVVAALRDQFVQRLNTSISYFMKELIAIAHDQAGQKTLSTEQAQVLNVLSKCDDRTVKDFADLMKKTKAKNTSDQFINITIRRGGVVKGKTFGRAGLVRFPIYEKLRDTKDPINGVKISVKDREMFLHLFEFVFPNITSDPEFYSVGVDSRAAPFLESLVRSTLNVIDALLETAQPYMAKLDIPELLSFPENLGEWRSIFEERDMVDKLASTIPPMGTNVAEEEEPAPKKVTGPSSANRDEPKREVEKEAPKPPAETSSSSTQVGNMVRSSSGRMVLGATSAFSAPSPSSGNKSPDRETRPPNERERREQEERERRERERELERDRERRERERRRKEEEEEDERRRERRERERERDRERDRDYDRHDRDRDRDRRDDRDRDRRTGDAFDDNPVLRGNLRDAEDDIRDRDRGRGRDRRDRYDDRDRGRGRSALDDRYRDIQDRRDRRSDRYDDRYDDRDSDYYGRRRR